MRTDELRRQLAALAADYQERLPDKVATIDRLWQDAMSGAWPPSVLQDLRRELHSLVGSAGTFGVANVGELARTAEALIEPYCERGLLPDRPSTVEFSRLLDAMRRCATDA